MSADRSCRNQEACLKELALRFNDCIGRGDLDGLAGLMSEDHVFTDRENNVVVGKPDCIAEVWAPFFRLFPVYRNVFDSVTVEGTRVIMTGTSHCSEAVLDQVKAIWIAEITGDKVASWLIYDDTEQNRERLGLTR